MINQTFKRLKQQNDIQEMRQRVLKSKLKADQEKNLQLYRQARIKKSALPAKFNPQIKDNEFDRFEKSGKGGL